MPIATVALKLCSVKVENLVNVQNDPPFLKSSHINDGYFQYKVGTHVCQILTHYMCVQSTLRPCR